MSSNTQLNQAFEEAFQLLKAVNPNLNIIITISPVKHYRDGVVENNLSKGILHLHKQNILDSAVENVYYFPSYEIVNDELRDYRFYDTDFAHPNQQAIEYVFTRFIDFFYGKKSLEIIEQLSSLGKLKAHKPKISSPENIKIHQENIRLMEQKIKTSYPNLYFGF